MENKIGINEIENGEMKKILMKGKDIVQTNYLLKPVENKMFQLVLYNNQKQKHNGICECEIPILEFQDLMANNNDKNLKEIEKRLKSIMKKSLTFYNSKIKGEYQLISGYEVIPERNSINVIMLERVVEIMQQYQENKKKLSPYAPINLSLFFELRSFYAQKLYDELRLWSRHNKEIVQSFSLDEIRFITGVGDKYPKWCNFYQKVLNVAVKEINEKAKMKVAYKPIKRNRVVERIEFTIFDYEPHIYFSNKGFIEKLQEIKNMNISKLEESFRAYIDKEIKEIESLLLNNSSEDDRQIIEKKIENLKKEIKDKINEFNLSGKIVIEECIDISNGALRLFKNDFAEIDFNDNNYYILLMEAFAKTIDKTEGCEITSDKNYRYFKTVLKKDIEMFENQKSLEDMCNNEGNDIVEDIIECDIDKCEENDNSLINEIIDVTESQEDIYNENITLENIKTIFAPIKELIGEVSYKTWFEGGIKDISLEGNIINIITTNQFTTEILSKRYSKYIDEVIKVAFDQIKEVKYIVNT